MNRTLASLLALAAVATTAHGQAVQIIGGNLFYNPGGGQPARQLTATGGDGEATISPDGQLVAFVRRSQRLPIEAGAGPFPATDLWLIRIDGTGARRVLAARPHDDLKRLLAGLNALHFSPDGRTLYFISAAWVTSGAIHSVDVDTGEEGFVCAGNSLDVLSSGRYVGHLLVTQHRYFQQGGSYNWVWLYSPEGREVTLVGDPEAPGFAARLAEIRGGVGRR